MHFTQIMADPRYRAALQIAENRGSAMSGTDDAAESWMLGRMAGRSVPMQHLFARMKCTAPYFRLAAVEGEPGTGKSLTAQTLHRMGAAAAGPFVHCSATEFAEKAETLWKGNQHGLLYLTGVDELPPVKQRQLSDFLAHAAREQIRMQMNSGPLQLVAGSSQPLRRMAAAGAFRGDLASHLTTIRFVLPPLRERREDIPLLAGLFLRRWSEEHGKALRGFAPGVMETLHRYEWPGNVGELESAITAAALTCTGQWIRLIDIPHLPWPAAISAISRDDVACEDPNLDRTIFRHITRVLARTGGNKVRAARMLGISRSTLYRLLDPASGGTRDPGAP